jgi:hypothetical protein
VGSEPLGKFSTLLDSSTAYKNADLSRYDPLWRVLNMELLRFTTVVGRQENSPTSVAERRTHTLNCQNV